MFLYHRFIRVGLCCILSALIAGCTSTSSVPSPSAPSVASTSPTLSSSSLQSVEVLTTQAAAVLASAGKDNPCTTGSLGLVQQISGSNFTVTVAPVACVMLGWTINGNPSVSFSGTFSDAAGDAGSGTGPVGGFTMVSGGQTVSCTIPAPGQTFTFSAGGEHGSQSGGPYVCNGTTYMLPTDSW